MTTSTVQTPARARSYHTRDVVARHLAPKLGRSVEATHQLLVSRTIERRHALAVEAHIEADAGSRLEKFLDVTEQVLDRRTTPPLTLGLLTEKMTIDGRESVELVTFAAHLEDPERARACVRHLYAESASDQLVARAICRHFGFRP